VISISNWSDAYIEIKIKTGRSIKTSKDDSSIDQDDYTVFVTKDEAFSWLEELIKERIVELATMLGEMSEKRKN
jgi:DNA primase large subunit